MNPWVRTMPSRPAPSESKDREYAQEMNMYSLCASPYYRNLLKYPCAGFVSGSSKTFGKFTSLFSCSREPFNAGAIKTQCDRHPQIQRREDAELYEGDFS